MANDTSGQDTTSTGSPAAYDDRTAAAHPLPQEAGRDSETTFYARPAAAGGPSDSGRHAAYPGAGREGWSENVDRPAPTSPYPAAQQPYQQARPNPYPAAGGGTQPTGGFGPVPQYPAPYPSPQPPPPPRKGSAGGRGVLVLLAVALAAALLGGGVGGAVGAALAGGAEEPVAQAPSDTVAPLPGVDEAGLPVGPVEAVAERVLPSVVQLLVETRGGATGGSGMVLNENGTILTNNHVVEAAAQGGAVTVVFDDGTTAPAEIVGLDPSSDLAVVRAQGVSGLTPIELGNSDAVQVGQQVVAVGSPLGLGGTVTTGIISAVDRAVSVGQESGASEATVLNALQTDAAINPGNSGGPLVDLQGRVVGINSVIATTGEQGGSIGVGFAIPVNQAQRIAAELERTGTATRAVLGVSLPPSDPTALTGAVLGPISPGGPADMAGLQEGDVVTQLDDRQITGNDELVAAIRDRAPGDEVTLTVDGQQVPVTLAGESG